MMLDKIPQVSNVDIVFIENQPNKRVQMNKMSCFLASYFIKKKVDDKKIKQVKLCSPSNKLKINSDKSIEVLKRNNPEYKNYSLNKKLAIEYTNKLLEDDKYWLDHLNKYKKKDDLCDALLQGHYYLTRFN